jgi:hypothetical protein
VGTRKKTTATPSSPTDTNATPDIVTFVRHLSLLGLSISPAQETLLRGAYGLPFVTDEQQEIWWLCTERAYTGRPYPEITVMCGARGGKDSRIAAPIVLYEALFGGHETRAAKGESATIVLVAQDARAAGVAFGYIAGYLQQSPVLSQMLHGDPLTSSLTLTNGITVMCFPCTLRSMRGFSIPVAVLDEVAFFRLEGQADSDVEIQASVRRGMVGFGDRTKLLKISTPYMRGGLLYDDVTRSFGKPDPDLLVWRATSRLMNPVTFSSERLDREQRLDPVRFRREYLAEFADDVAAFLPQHVIDAAIRPGRHALPPRDGIRYVMAVDPSGGGPDAFTCSVVHAEGRGADLRVVQDVLKGWATRGTETVDLEGIVAEIAEIARRYRCRTVFGDRYSRDWVVQSFKRRGIHYDADYHVYIEKEKKYLEKSGCYLEAEPLFTQGRIELLDDPTLRRELVCLEKRSQPGNKFQVDHPRSAGAHDDYANSTCLAAAVASRDRAGMLAGYPEPAPKSEQRPGGHDVIGASVRHWTCPRGHYEQDVWPEGTPTSEKRCAQEGWSWDSVLRGGWRP